MLFVRWVLDLDVKLSHGAYEGLCAVDKVLKYRMAIERELVVCVTILVYDFHLLDNGAFAAFSRAYKRYVSMIRQIAVPCACSLRAACVGSRLPYLAARSCIRGAASLNPPLVPDQSSGCASSGRPHRSLHLTCTHPS
jgi:hypothetical protein